MVDIWTLEQVDKVSDVGISQVFDLELLHEMKEDYARAYLHGELKMNLHRRGLPSHVNLDDCVFEMNEPDFSRSQVKLKCHWEPKSQAAHFVDGANAGALFIMQTRRAATIEFKRFPRIMERNNHGVVSFMEDIYELCGWHPTERAWAYKHKETR